ncbi:collagen binding domain-containing protein, partial [Pontibacillus litoralis]
MRKQIGAVSLIVLLLFQTITTSLMLPMQAFAQANQSNDVITDITLLDEQNSQIDQETPLRAGQKIQFALNWEVGPEQIEKQKKYSVQLPTQVQPTIVEKASLTTKDGTEIGTYSVSKDATLTINFDEFQEKKQGDFHVSAAITTDELNKENFSFVADSGTIFELPVTWETTESQKSTSKEQQSPDTEKDTSAQEENGQNNTHQSSKEEQSNNGEDASDSAAQNHEDDTINKKENASTQDADKQQDKSSDDKNAASKKDNEQDATNTDKQKSNGKVAKAGPIKENILTDVTLTDEDGEIINEDENPNNPLKLGDVVNIEYKFALPNNHGYEAGSAYTFDFPEQFKISGVAAGDLTFNGGSIGTFIADESGKVTLTFNEKIEQLSNIEGYVNFATKLTEDLTGDPEQDIPFEIDGDRVDIPIKVKPDVKNTIDKRGTPDKHYNANEIHWEVDFNKGLDKLENATFQDPILDGQELQKNSIKIYKLNVDVQGNVSKGEEVTKQFATSTDDGNVTIDFGTISEAYRVEFTTDITDEDGKNYTNKATVSSDNLDDLTASSTISVGRGKPLEKAKGKYDSANQTIEWQIKFNYNEKDIAKQDAILKDLFNDSMHLVDGSLEVREITIDSDGKGIPGDIVNNYKIKDITDTTNNKEGFELQFTEDISKAYIITYTTKADDRVFDAEKITNTVSYGDNESSVDQGVSQQIGIKKHGKVKYNEKTVDWKVDINQDSHVMNHLVITDTFTNGGLTLKEDTINIKELEQGKDYNVQVNENGFKITFNVTIDKPITLTYTTHFDFETLNDGKNKFLNTVHFEWENEAGKKEVHEDEEPFNPDNYTKNNGFKGGSYNAQTKEITWDIGVNYNLQHYADPSVEDFILGDQTLLKDSIKVYEMTLNGGPNEINIGNQLEEGKDYTLSFPEDEQGNPGFRIDFNDSIDSAYFIRYNTTLKDHHTVPSYNNTATFKNADEKMFEQDATVSVKNGGSYTEKSGKQDGLSAKWRVDINKGQSTVSDVVITDKPSNNQLYIEDSFKLYGTTVSKNGTVKKDTSNVLEEGKDYELEIHRDEESGQESFTLNFSNTIQEPYVLEYTSYINAANGEIISNNATFEGSGLSEDPPSSSASFRVQISGSGGGSGELGSLEVKKVDSETNEPLEGATFTLYDRFGNIAIKTGTTNDQGIVSFNNLLYRDYILKEDSAPSGYHVAIDDQQTVTIDADPSKVTVKNDIIKGKAKLTKVDADNNKVKLDGAVFKVVDKNGADVKTGLTTNDKGVITVELRPGDYQFVETKAPFGYDLDNT